MKLEDYYRGKAILITGASSGMGKDLALLLAGYGTKLALAARRKELLEELKLDCEREGAEVQLFAVDITDQAAMLAMRDQLIDSWGFIHIVVANAGVGGLNPAESFSLEINQRTVEINCLGLANTVVPFIPSMVERKDGQLVCISSLSAFRGLPKAASYSSSKSAQRLFMESLRVDLRPHGIAVSCIHPGFIESPMTEHDDFRMPFMVPVRESSILIAKAMMKKLPVYLYPWQMRLLTQVNRMLPPFIYDRLVPLLSGQKKSIKPKFL